MSEPVRKTPIVGARIYNPDSLEAPKSKRAIQSAAKAHQKAFGEDKVEAKSKIPSKAELAAERLRQQAQGSSGIVSAPASDQGSSEFFVGPTSKQQTFEINITPTSKQVSSEIIAAPSSKEADELRYKGLVYAGPEAIEGTKQWFANYTGSANGILGNESDIKVPKARRIA